MKNTNEMELIFDSLSANEGFARVAVAAFMKEGNYGPHNRFDQTITRWG